MTAILARTAPDPSPWLGTRSFENWLEEFDENGYIVVENALNNNILQDVRKALRASHEADLLGRNAFEGSRTNRVSALLAKGRVFADLAMHPLAMAVTERDIGTSCLLSAAIAINIHPGESAQAWHNDDGHIDMPRPRPSFGVGAFWAIDETTDQNGATEVLPGSHHWGGEPPAGALSPEVFARNATDPNAIEDRGAHPDAVKITMAPGSVLIIKASLWHRGGANRSAASRLVVVTQYCPGWARQIENQLLAVPPAIAATLPQRARELLGYSIHPPFMGFVDGVHPDKTLNKSVG